MMRDSNDLLENVSSRTSQSDSKILMTSYLEFDIQTENALYIPEKSRILPSHGRVRLNRERRQDLNVPLDKDRLNCEFAGIRLN